METQHIRSLDGLRGIAALAVTVTHLGLIFPHVSGLEKLTFGGEAVSLFFSLSGFLMAYLYGGRSLTRKAAADYLVHRFARIYPIYIVAVVTTALVSLLFVNFPVPLIGSTELLRHVALLGSTGVFWSIPPEIQFYFLFLVLWFWFENPGRRSATGAAIVLGFALFYLLGFPGPGILLPSKIEYFMLGALAGRLYALLPKGNPSPLTGLAALLAVLVHFLLYKLVLDSNDYWGMTSALTATATVILVAFDAKPSATILAMPPLRFLGNISFSLYLFHMPVMFLVSILLPDAVPLPVKAAMCISAAIACASITHRLIERPAREAIVSVWRRKPRLAFV